MGHAGLYKKEQGEGLQGEFSSAERLFPMDKVCS